MTLYHASLLSFFRNLGIFICILFCAACNSKEKVEYTEIKDGKELSASFVGSETCKTCHLEQFQDQECQQYLND